MHSQLHDILENINVLPCLNDILPKLHAVICHWKAWTTMKWAVKHHNKTYCIANQQLLHTDGQKSLRTFDRTSMCLCCSSIKIIMGR